MTKISLRQKTEDDENDGDVIVVRPKDMDEDYIQGVVQDRRFMQAHCLRSGKDCRYAFKGMQKARKQDASMFVNAVVDMALEAKFLAAVRHPNIIKMRAMASGDLCQANFFIIMDRLYDTLNDRIQQWQKKQSNGLVRLFDFQKKKEKRFIAERLTVAYDIASALEYLHNLK